MLPFWCFPIWPTKFCTVVYNSLINPSCVSFLWSFWINLLPTACANCCTPWTIWPWILLIEFSCVSNSPRKLQKPIFNLVKTPRWKYDHVACIFPAIRLWTPSQVSCGIHTIASRIAIDRSHQSHLRIDAVPHFLGSIVWSTWIYTHLSYLVGFGHCHPPVSHLATFVWCQLCADFARFGFFAFETLLHI